MVLTTFILKFIQFSIILYTIKKPKIFRIIYTFKKYKIEILNILLIEKRFLYLYLLLFGIDIEYFFEISY